jgi:hypothetical protein
VLATLLLTLPVSRQGLWITRACVRAHVFFSVQFATCFRLARRLLPKNNTIASCCCCCCCYRNNQSSESVCSYSLFSSLSLSLWSHMHIQQRWLLRACVGKFGNIWRNVSVAQVDRKL